MLVSVVVPAYNEDNYIGACLNSLRQLEHPDFDVKLIVVDDGSTDRTGAIAASFGARVVTQPNGGVAKARQTGFEAARGAIIASTDADTTVPVDWLERIVADLRARPNAVAVHGPIRYHERAFVEQNLIYCGTTAIQWLHCAIGRPAFVGSNFAVRREAWKQVGGFDLTWASYEDAGLSMKLRKVGLVMYDRRLVVRTSARRIRAGYREVLGFYGKNYVRVLWLNKPGPPFKNIR
ncbi:MAG: glycosyltransferase family 2 protein [Chloroflexi bacterium]|nr:glycosyltransferase family 2 protein [Chloroflexota bacterium]